MVVGGGKVGKEIEVKEEAVVETVEEPVKPVSEIITGSKTYEEGLIRVVSKSSLSENFVPEGTKKYIDAFTGELEEVAT